MSWTSALPLRQARVRELVGQNGMLTPDLETFLATPMPVYVVTLKIEGFTAAMAARTVVQITKDTSLRRDGKPPIAVAEAQSAQLDKDGNPIEPPKPPAAGSAPPAPVGPGGGRGGFGGGFGGRGTAGGSTVIVFAFPKTDAITAGDKEVEIVSKVGQYSVKKKFKLKDMVVKGELAL